MPRLLICGFGAFPNFPANPSALAVERLRAVGWSPPGAAADYAILPTTWAGATDALRARIDATGADGVLLTGVAASAKAFRIELKARNLACTTAPDADGLCRPDPTIEALGSVELDASAPVEAMLAAIRAAGLPAEPSSNAGDYLCNFTFYRLLAARPCAGPLAFLHLPPAPEAPPETAAGGRCLSLDDLVAGVKAAAEALALAFPPAGRFNGRDRNPRASTGSA